MTIDRVAILAPTNNTKLGRETMKARLYAIVFAALSMTGFSTAVLADNDINNVSWKRVIGLIQAGNMVGNIQGGGQP